MRWDRLFDDLEALAGDLEQDERDALADQLRDGDWADTRWWQLLGGRVVLELAGGGRVEGVVTVVNERLVLLAGRHGDHVVSTAAVVVVHEAERRADPGGRVQAALGWGRLFRGLRDAGEEITVRLVDGSTREGLVTVVGGDFTRIVVRSGAAQDVVWTAIAMVSGRT